MVVYNFDAGTEVGKARLYTGVYKLHTRVYD